MKKLLLLLVLASQCHGAIALVQQSNFATGNPTLNTVVAGNLLVVGLSVFSATNTVTGITDSSGDTWVHATNALAANNASLNERTDWWYDSKNTGATSGTHTLTVTVTGGTSFSRQMFELSGQNAASPFDVAATGQGNASNPSVSLTPAASGEAILAYAVTSSGPTAGSGFTLTTGSPAGNNFFESAEYNLSAGTGAQSVAFTKAAAIDYCISAIAINPAGGAAKTCTVSATGAGPC